MLDFNKIKENKKEIVKLYLYNRGFYHSYNTALMQRKKAFSYEGKEYSSLKIQNALDDYFNIRREVKHSTIDKMRIV